LKKLGKYEVLAELGHGAMGVVYRARDPIINRLVAVKTITTGVANDPAMLQRFYREAQSAGGLQHPNIITIYDMGNEGDLPYIAMELVEGENLEQVIARRAAIPVSLKLVYAIQACRAFDYAHKRGIVHRDIKPGNVMVTKDGTVKVVDFGIARVLETSKTQTGMLIGTFAYMSPEQYHGEHADERSDIWSFGVLLYELLSCHRPFTGVTPASLMHSICQQEPEPLSKFLPECPSELEVIVSRILQKSPGERYQSMEELLLELEPVCKTLQAQSVAELVGQSRQFIERSEFTEAREVLRVALQVESSNQQVRSLLEKVNSELKRILVRPKAQQYVEKGRAFLEEGKIQEARVAAESALHLDSSFEPAQELQRVVRQELDRAQLIAGWLESAKQHLAEGLPDEAESWLARVLEAEPSNQQAVVLQQQALKEKAERQKRLRLLQMLQNARGLWTRQDYTACIQLLVDSGKEFPDEEEVSRLLETVREDQTEQRLQALLGCRSLLAAGRYEECFALLITLQEQFPGDEEISRLLEDARRDQVDHRRRQGLTEARGFLSAGQHDECISLLAALGKEFPDEQEIPALLETVRQNQKEQRRQHGVAEARKLLAARRYEECASLLVALEKQFPKDNEVVKLLEEVREEQTEQRKQQGLADVRKLLATRNYEESFALLASMQKEFPEEDEIRKLLESAHEEQAEQRKREGLAQARKLLASRRYDESIAFLSKLQEDFPSEGEISKLLETAREDRAEQQKQQKLAEARTRLAAQSFGEALTLLDGLAEVHPKDAGVLKLRSLVQREQEKQARAERIQRELDVLKKLMSEKRYPEVISKTKQLLTEFPGETNFRRLAEFAGGQQESIEKELLLRNTLGEVKALFNSNRFKEAIGSCETGLRNFPANPELLDLHQQAEIQQRKLEIRQKIEQRVREIRVKINREKFSEAIGLAKQTLVTLGPDTDVTQLLNSAEVELEAREKKREQGRALETIRTLMESGDLQAASQALDETLETKILETFDPRIQRLAEQIKDSKAVVAGEPAPSPPSIPPSISREYAFTQGTPMPSAPAPPENISLAGASAAQGAAVQPALSPQHTVPITPPEEVSPPPSLSAQPAQPMIAESGEPSAISLDAPASRIEVQELASPDTPVTAGATFPAAVSIWRRPAVVGVLGLVVLVAAWVGARSTLWKWVQPPAKTNPQPSKPKIDPLEVQQRVFLNAAGKLIAANDLDGARGKLQQAAALNGPLASDVQQKISQIDESMKDANLRQLRQREEQLWQQALKRVADGRFGEARRGLNQILALSAGGVRRDEAQSYLDKVIPQQIKERDLLAQAHLDLSQSDFQSARWVVQQLQQNGSDPASLVTEIAQAEQKRLAQLENQFNQAKQRDDDAAVQQLKVLLPRFQALANDGSPQSAEALGYANNIPAAIGDVQARAQKKSADAAFQQTVQRYEQAASATDKNGLAAARTEFQSMVQSGGPHVEEAKKYLANVNSTLAVLNEPPILPVKPPVKAETPPVVTVDNDAAVRAIIQRYAQAFNQRDVDILQQVWPSMRPRYADYKSSFDMASSIRMRVDIESIELNAGNATAVVKGQVSQDYTPKGFKAKGSKNAVTFHLAKTNGAWVIMDVQ
jgi:serine/threonine protein kinase/predicted Zn-dependent protease